MRASFNRFMLSFAIGCLFLTSIASAQHYSHTMVPANGATGMGESNYVPAQPMSVYTNQQVYDPLAYSEAAYYPQYANSAGGYPQFYGDTYGYPVVNQCETYSPGLTCGKWFVTGWLDQGFTYNTRKPRNSQNGPLKFNDRSEEYQLNQAYLVMGRNVATSGNCWDFGGRVDLLYGSDYLWTSAVGLETHTQLNGMYQEDPNVLPSRWNSDGGVQRGLASASRFGLAMPQLYAEFYVPLHYGLNVKAGHFYSIMGYESAMSPRNFFYSRSYSMMYGQPMTHTGILFSQRLTPRLTGIFGVTRGWNTWEDPNGKMSYLGGFSWASCDKRTEISLIGHTGNETVSHEDGGVIIQRSKSEAIRSHYSFVLSHQLTGRLKLVTQHDLGYEKDAAFEMIDGNTRSLNGHWYSLSQYAFYQLTDTLSLGVRGEWFRDVNSSRVMPLQPVRVTTGGVVEQEIRGADYSHIAVGLNWKPYDCLVVRPEARWDWSDVYVRDNMTGTNLIGGVYDDHQRKSQSTISLSAYVTF